MCICLIKIISIMIYTCFMEYAYLYPVTLDISMYIIFVMGNHPNSEGTTRERGHGYP